MEEVKTIADAMMCYVEQRVVHKFDPDFQKEVMAGTAQSEPPAAAQKAKDKETEKLVCKSCLPACFGYRRNLELSGPERAGLGVLRLAPQGQRSVAIVFISELMASYQKARAEPCSVMVAQNWFQSVANLEGYVGTVWRAQLLRHSIASPNARDPNGMHHV